MEAMGLDITLCTKSGAEGLNFEDLLKKIPLKVYTKSGNEAMVSRSTLLGKDIKIELNSTPTKIEINPNMTGGRDVHFANMSPGVNGTSFLTVYVTIEEKTYSVFITCPQAEKTE